MNRAYALLLGTIVVAGLSLGAWSRHRPTVAAPEAATVSVVSDTLELQWSGSGLSPADSHVAFGHRLVLRIENRSARTTRVSLAGYEPQFSGGVIAPGETLRAAFELQLPGEDFAWLVDGRPVAKLRVVGPHLVEGHR